MTTDDLPVTRSRAPATTLLQLKIRAAEKEAIKAEAARRDVSLSEFMRACALREVARSA